MWGGWGVGVRKQEKDAGGMARGEAQSKKEERPKEGGDLRMGRGVKAGREGWRAGGR